MGLLIQCLIDRFLVRATYLEIYNEEIRDLLGKDQNTRLEVKERPDIGVFVKDLSGYVVNNADDLDRIMSLGNKNRKYLDILTKYINFVSYVLMQVLIIMKMLAILTLYTMNCYKCSYIMYRCCWSYSNERIEFTVSRNIYNNS